MAVLSPSFCGEQVIHVNVFSYLKKFFVGDLYDQKIRMMFRMHFVWKVESCLKSVSVIRQHSEPYSKVNRTQL